MNGTGDVMSVSKTFNTNPASDQWAIYGITGQTVQLTMGGNLQAIPVIGNGSAAMYDSGELSYSAFAAVTPVVRNGLQAPGQAPGVVFTYQPGQTDPVSRYAMNPSGTYSAPI